MISKLWASDCFEGLASFFACLLSRLFAGCLSLFAFFCCWKPQRRTTECQRAARFGASKNWSISISFSIQRIIPFCLSALTSLFNPFKQSKSLKLRPNSFGAADRSASDKHEAKWMPVMWARVENQETPFNASSCSPLLQTSAEPKMSIKWHWMRTC